MHGYKTWWRHQMEIFSAQLALCAGDSPVPVNSPHKGLWRGGLMFSLICVWINGWVNNREAGDLRRHRSYYDVNVMVCNFTDYMVNFEIRVGEDGTEIGNNKICSKQIEKTSSANFTCSPVLLGDWVSINKSSTHSENLERLVLNEVRVFSECWWLP